VERGNLRKGPRTYITLPSRLGAYCYKFWARAGTQLTCSTALLAPQSLYDLVVKLCLKAISLLLRYSFIFSLSICYWYFSCTFTLAWDLSWHTGLGPTCACHLQAPNHQI
jgi:hypothetical protein